jgi:hypothetical protein
MISSCTDAFGLGMKPLCVCFSQKSGTFDKADISVLPLAVSMSLSSTPAKVEDIEKIELARLRGSIAVESHLAVDAAFYSGVGKDMNITRISCRTVGLRHITCSLDFVVHGWIYLV